MSGGMVPELGRSLHFLVHKVFLVVLDGLTRSKVVFKHHMISAWSAFAHYALMLLL